MRTRISTRFLIPVALSTALLSACAIKPAVPELYDLGPLHADDSGTARSGLPPLAVADIKSPMWLDTQTMYFRLSYASNQQPRPYANSRWVMPPAALFAERLKSRLAQAGGVVTSTADGAANTLVLRMEADDFTQNFTSPEQSNARIAIRASLFDGRVLIAQRTFMHQAPAPTADATGGASAFAMASDAVIADMTAWLTQLPLKK
ncbi:MAG TPA: ABC-type transport auxiliary lipoprotein family protein [Paucimonas sp.]|nr:ABC-type transport auxiliary lipoprotein family protein [Paucimonas sp.]HJW54380.1 ABC-type transport auxiliary lipoprotein family protein [Burkholderiaceae bacterium]